MQRLTPTRCSLPNSRRYQWVRDGPARLLLSSAGPKNLDDLERHHDLALSRVSRPSRPRICAREEGGEYVSYRGRADPRGRGVGVGGVPSGTSRGSRRQAAGAVRARVDTGTERTPDSTIYAGALGRRRMRPNTSRHPPSGSRPSGSSAGRGAQGATELQDRWRWPTSGGEPMSYALARLHLCQLELRVGDWDAASRLLDQWAESADRELQFRPMYERCRVCWQRARVAPVKSSVGVAKATRAAARVGSRWDELEGLRASGIGSVAGARARASRREPALGVGPHATRAGR